MECQEYEALLPGYLDGELDLMQSVGVEKHLDACEKCRQVVENERSLKSAMRSGALYHGPRQSLERDILRSVQKKERTMVAPAFLKGRRYAFAAAFATLLLLVGWGVGRFHTVPPETDLIANEALAGHLRSLMVGHLVDVVSSDKHTVKPWFNGKVDYSPPVIDMADQGFPLTGGRLDYLDGRPVTALVYGRQKHVINLFLWPVMASDSETALQSRRGYNLIHWTKSHLAFWAVSDLNATELREFADRYQERVALASRP